MRLPPCPRYARITLFVAEHLRGRPRRDQRAEVEHRGGLAARRRRGSCRGRRGSERPGVLGDPPDHVAQMLGLLVGQAGRGLVEQHEPRRPTTARATSTSRRSPAPSVPTWRRVGPRVRRTRSRRARLARGWRARGSSARGPSPRCRRSRAPRSPARSGRCAAAPSARGGSGPSRAGPRRRRVTLPAAGLMNPLRTLKKVVLPAPLGPISPHVPSRRCTSTPSSGMTPPKRTVSSDDLDHVASPPTVGLRTTALAAAARAAPVPRHLIDESTRERWSGPAARRSRRGSSASPATRPRSLSSAARN